MTVNAGIIFDSVTFSPDGAADGVQDTWQVPAGETYYVEKAGYVVTNTETTTISDSDYQLVTTIGAAPENPLSIQEEFQVNGGYLFAQTNAYGNDVESREDGYVAGVDGASNWHAIGDYLYENQKVGVYELTDNVSTTADVRLRLLGRRVL